MAVVATFNALVIALLRQEFFISIRLDSIGRLRAATLLWHHEWVVLLTGVIHLSLRMDSYLHRGLKHAGIPLWSTTHSRKSRVARAYRRITRLYKNESMSFHFANVVARSRISKFVLIDRIFNRQLFIFLTLTTKNKRQLWIISVMPAIDT